jgi:bifunctional DNA-binding transcriptional regulator/antitoxin component of YhaV-PrlF toxin-antitoxin module
VGQLGEFCFYVLKVVATACTWRTPSRHYSAELITSGGDPRRLRGGAFVRVCAESLISDESVLSAEPGLSEMVLTVGKKGEIYTNDSLRKKVGIRKRGKVRAVVVEGRLVIEPLPSLEDVLASPLVAMTPDEVEEAAEEAQKEAGVYG